MESAHGQRQVVGGILVGYGIFCLAAAAAAVWVFELDLGFIRPLDMAVIAMSMVGVGWAMRQVAADD